MLLTVRFICLMHVMFNSVLLLIHTINMIASGELQKDLWIKIHNQVIRKEIPYHFIAGRTGDIVLKDAPTAMQKEELKMRIEELSAKE